jgi:hypothetical protein
MVLYHPHCHVPRASTGHGCGLSRARVRVAKSPPATNPHPQRGLPKPTAGCFSRHRGGRGIPFLTSPTSACSIRVAATHGNKSPLQVAAVLLQLNACQLRERTSPFPRVSSRCQTHPGHTVRPWTVRLRLGVASGPIQAIRPTPNPNPCGYDFKGLLACQRCVLPFFPVIR